MLQRLHTNKDREVFATIGPKNLCQAQDRINEKTDQAFLQIEPILLITIGSV